MSELVILDTDYPVLTDEGSALVKELLAGLAGERLSMSDLGKVTVPGGGGKFWEIDDESEADLRGIIVHTHLQRGLWETSYEEGGGDEEPICSSHDGVVGHGDPGGDCATCPMAQFGSDGERPSCQTSRIVWMLREGENLPLHVKVPAKSLKPAKKYIFGLARKGLPVHGVVTKMALRVEEKPQRHSVVEFAMVEALEPAQVARIAAYLEQIRPLITYTERRENP